jgi:diguanylate cyclase (GGDEF)-like protein
MLGKNPASANVIWPANGLLLGIVLMAPYRRWPSYFACAAIVSVFIHIHYGYLDAKSLIFAVANTIEVLVAALIMRRQDRRPDLTRPRTLTVFLLTAVVVAPLFSSVTVLLCERAVGIPVGYVLGLGSWYLGDALGLAIMTPCVLAIRQHEIISWLKPGKRLEAVSLLGCTVLLALPIFYSSSYPSAVVFTPLLLLILFRLGTSGGAFALLLLTGLASYLTVRQDSVLSAQGRMPLTHGIFVLQLSLAVLILQVYVIGTALTEAKRVQLALAGAYERVEHLAGIDPLTQLANRRTFDAKLQQERSRCARDKTCLSILMIDVDRFKSFNDRYGHHVGDTILQAVSLKIANAAHRPSDLAARYGGEEFIVLLPATNSVGAFKIAEQLRETIGGLRIQDQNGQLPTVTVSIGVATAWPASEGNAERLIEGADRALYMAKDSGRNKVCVWIEDDQ